MQDLYKEFFKIAEARGQYKSILCLSGTLPGESFFASGQAKKLPIIACDGAINALHPLKIRPQIVLGDLDSANPEYLQGLQVLALPDQSKSDFQKGLEYLEQKKLLPSIILGLSGGFLDHILNNINIFFEGNNLFYSPPIVGFFLKTQNTTTFSLPINTKISIFGIPDALISTTGLKWDLDKAALSFPGKNSCLNRTAQEEISMTLFQGSVLVLIYLCEIEDAGRD